MARIRSCLGMFIPGRSIWLLGPGACDRSLDPGYRVVDLACEFERLQHSRPCADAMVRRHLAPASAWDVVHTYNHL